MREVVIRIGHAGGDDYPAEMFERDGATLTSLGPPKPMQLTAAELSGFAEVLPGNTPPAGLQGDGAALYGKLRVAIGQPLDDLMNGAPARIYLDLGASDLHRAPWEIMRWSKPGVGGSTEAFVSQAHHLCRVFQPDWSAQPADAQGPLRVLIAIGAPPGDLDVQAEQEEEEIRRRVQPAQRTVDIDVVQPANRKALYDKIKDFVPHVLHFIGHGTSNPPLVEFRGPAPAAAGGAPSVWTWKAGEVTTDVGRFNLDDWKPGLAFLNACRTGNANGQAAPMASAFLGSGAKAAIAMQGNIKGTAAGTLAGVFYERLAAGTEINEALSLARGIVAQEYGDKEAAYPALTMQCAPAATLPSFHCLGDDYQQRVAACKLLPRLTVFVNQLESRRHLCHNFWPLRAANLPQRFVLLRGDAGFGKTALSAWMLDLSLRLGYRVRYVSVKSEAGGVDYVKILKLIWGVQAPGLSSPLTDPLPGPSAELATLLETSKDTAVYGPFRQALAEVSNDRPVAIVLDEFEKSMDDGSFWILWEHLFASVAQRELKNVILVLVLGEDEYAQYEIDTQLKHRPELKIPRKEIKLKVLEAGEFVDRFSEYLYFRSAEFRKDNVKKLIEPMAGIFTKNDPKPLSVARFEEKAQEVARALSFEIEELR